MLLLHKLSSYSTLTFLYSSRQLSQINLISPDYVTLSSHPEIQSCSSLVLHSHWRLHTEPSQVIEAGPGKDVQHLWQGLAHHPHCDLSPHLPLRCADVWPEARDAPIDETGTHEMTNHVHMQ